MKEKIFPTSKDIYIELNGRKLAVVEGYKISAQKNIRLIKAFGEKEPVGIVEADDSYEIELSRLYFSNNFSVENEDFFSLKNFNLVIVKPDRRIIYTECNWKEIVETGEIGDALKERIKIFAKSKREIF